MIRTSSTLTSGLHAATRSPDRRTRDPALRQEFERMRFCPIQDRNGRCSRFVDYMLGALIRHGINQQYDLEDALQRIVFWMLSPVGERGLPRNSLFDFDENRPYDLRIGNPLQAIFRQYLSNAVTTIGMGKIPALRRVQYPKQVVHRLRTSRKRSGLRHRFRRGDSQPCPELRSRDAERPIGFASTAFDARRCHWLICSCRSSRARELVCSEAGSVIPLPTRGGKMIVQTISQYAQQTHNWSLLNLLDRIQNPDAPAATSGTRTIRTGVVARRTGLPQHRRCLGKEQSQRIDGRFGQSPPPMDGKATTRPEQFLLKPPL